MSRRLREFAARALVSLVLLAASTGAAQAGAEADRAFLAAYQAFRAGQLNQLDRYSGALEGQLFEPYFASWRIRLRLKDASSDEIRGFLARYAGAYAAEMARADWVKLLAERGEWASFERERALLATDDPEIACDELIARLERGEAVAIAADSAAWLAPERLPDDCDALARRLRAAGRLDADAVWLRVRELFDAGEFTEARRTFGYLPAGEAPRARYFTDAVHHPQRLFAGGRKQLAERFSHRPIREVAKLAVMRIAANAPGSAAQQVEGPLGSALSDEERGDLWGRVGCGAARRLDPRALNWYARSGDAPLDDTVRAWWVRAALREGDWASVRKAIDGMSAQARQESTWTYWYARALAAAGDAEGARTRYLALARGTGFYNLLAAEELGEPLRLPEERHEPTDDEVETARANPELARGLELRRLGLYDDAQSQWGYALRGMDDVQLLAAAELARREGAYDLAILSAGRTTYMHNYALTYLAPYRETFAQYADTHGVDEAWVLGVARQESRFTTHAHSSAGARGLMQITPQTARWMARREGIRHLRTDRISDIETNVTLGTRYLKTVMDQLGYPVLALAAYNAGPTRARRWRASVPLEGAVYVESIPYAETRNYVKKVMANAMFYAALLHGSAMSLKASLGVVPAAEPGRASAARSNGKHRQKRRKR